MKRIVIHSLVMVSLLLPSGGNLQAEQEQNKNLIHNAEFNQSGERLTGWIEKREGINNARFSVLDWSFYGEGQILYVDLWVYESGFAGWTFKPVHVKRGKSYVWKETFRNEGASAIRAEFKTTSGKILSEDLDVLLWHTWDEWVTITEEFIAPPDAISVSIYHCLTGQGAIAIRDVSLVEK